MLPIEELDKKNYSEILADSVSNIKRFTDEWTDLGQHDPGITILQMLTWLTDMQRYYLNRVTQKNKLKFLKLYGINLLEQTKAATYVEFESTRDNIVLAKGTKLLADEQVFETIHSNILTNNSIKKAITATEFLETDNTHVLSNKNIAFYPFDINIQDGNKLYIGFENKMPLGSKIDIYFDVIDDYLVKINQADTIKYHINYKWMLYSTDEKWHEINVLKDTTGYLTKKGNITVSIDYEMELYDFFADADEKYWICIEVYNVGVNLSPKVRTIALNYFPVENKNTIATFKDFMNSDENVFDDNIFYTGDIIIQRKATNGYVDLDSNEYQINRNEKNKTTIISNIDKAYKELRIIGYYKDITHRLNVGSSNGLPYQKIYYPLDKVIASELVIQTASYKNGAVYWNDYHYVRDFSLAINKERVFELDIKNQLLIFGDNEGAIVPEKNILPIENIRIVNLVYSDKARGNVKDGEIKSFLNSSLSEEGIRIKYADTAIHGIDSMQINDGIVSLLENRDVINRAVTTKDYEDIVKNTPGLRISLAKAIQNNELENSIIIIVVPYTAKRFSMPDNRMLSIVKKYLDRYRLITTNISVVQPKYIGISVNVNIKASMTNKFDSDRLKKLLFEYLTPINSQKINFSYNIGSAIYLSDIIELINSFENVDFIEYIRIDGKGEGAKRDKEGNIVLPYNGISYADSIEINIY